ncbi:MAG: hypothetical protein HYU51_08580 [Candidatus Rokubacteria bacterium]|nr:hypothetical protein [Candidatus Rokubacteria bacterium]
MLETVRGLPPRRLEEGRYENGWNGREILAHLASIEWTYPRLIEIAREAPEPDQGHSTAQTPLGAPHPPHARWQRRLQRPASGQACPPPGR